jgi:hypothetical protein
VNLVGAGGKGESVWLGFFLFAVLTQFGALATRRGDALLASRCTSESVRLRNAIERSGWDGDWYSRGWFDDGSPLRTASNVECRITSIVQSWSVLSGAGDPDRSRRAMRAADTHQVRRDAALVQLLDPPFDHSNPSPGYIQGSVRGVRENGQRSSSARYRREGTVTDANRNRSSGGVMTAPISALAGKAAPFSSLINLAKLVTAYCEIKPDPSVAAQRVVFGTSGHRGSAFDGTFNERHVPAVTQAICDFRRAPNGVNVMLATNDEYAPTPVIPHAILSYSRVAIT